MSDVSRYGRRSGNFPDSVDETSQDSNQELFDHDDPVSTVYVREGLNFRLAETGDLRIYPTLHWNDLRAPATAINPPGIASDPTFDTTEIGYVFSNGSTEVLFILLQMDHSWMVGTDVYPHVHWIQEAVGEPLWQMEYKWFVNGHDVPASFTTIESEGNAFTYDSGSLSQISSFGAVSPPENAGLSSIIKLKLSRLGGDVGDTYDADVLFSEFDIHFAIDYLGSAEQYEK